MAKTEILRSFVQLGENIRTNINRDELIQSALNENAWFTRQSIEKAFEGLSNYLNADKLEQWSSSYPFTKNTQKIGLVMAGNIPFVGFHDLLSVLVSGHKAVVKLSSDDRVLMRWVIEELIAINPQLQHRIFITDLLKDIEAVIATGSNNTARYFDYYFSKYPHIIRKNRNAVAVLDGTESQEQLENLAEDIFSYFGLGCRNVSKLYVPEGYNFNFLFECLNTRQAVIQHHKYANNYDYYKSILLVNKEAHLDNGFVLLQQNKKISSPVAVLYYDFYIDLNEVRAELDKRQEEIQCIVADKNKIPEAINFGNSQNPELWDYADNVDTMAFLAKL